MPHDLSFTKLKAEIERLLHGGRQLAHHSHSDLGAKEQTSVRKFLETEAYVDKDAKKPTSSLADIELRVAKRPQDNLYKAILFKSFESPKLFLVMIAHNVFRFQDDISHLAISFSTRGPMAGTKKCAASLLKR